MTTSMSVNQQQQQQEQPACAHSLVLFPDEVLGIVVSFCNGRDRQRILQTNRLVGTLMVREASVVGSDYEHVWSLCRLAANEPREKTPEETFHRVMTAHTLFSIASVHAPPRLYWKHGLAPRSNNAWRSTIFVTSHNALPYGRVPYLFSSGCIWIAFGIQSHASVSHPGADPDWIHATVEVTERCTRQASKGTTRFLDIPAYYACRHEQTDTAWYMGVYACSFTDHEDKRINARLPDGTRVQVLSIRTARFHDFSIDSRVAVFDSQPCLYVVARPWEHYPTSDAHDVGAEDTEGEETKQIYVFQRQAGTVTNAAGSMVKRTFTHANYVSVSVRTCNRILMEKVHENSFSETWRGLFFNRRPPASESRVSAYIRNRDIRTKAVVHMDRLTVKLWTAWLRIGALTPTVCASRNMHIPLSSGWWPSGTWQVTVE